MQIKEDPFTRDRSMKTSCRRILVYYIIKPTITIHLNPNQTQRLVLHLNPINFIHLRQNQLSRESFTIKI